MNIVILWELNGIKSTEKQYIITVYQIDTNSISVQVWSPTFVLVTCGFASLLLVFLTWLIDIRKKQKWGYPFHVFGTNPLFIYIVAGVLATLLEVITVGESSLQEKIYTSIWSVLPDAHLASLIYGLLFIGFNYLIVWGLYKKQLFIKI